MAEIGYGNRCKNMAKSQKGNYQKKRTRVAQATEPKPVEYGKMSKKDREFIQDYGQSQGDLLNSGSDLKFGRVFKEEDFDGHHQKPGKTDRKKRRIQEAPVQVSDSEDDFEVSGPSAFDVLMESFKDSEKLTLVESDEADVSEADLSQDEEALLSGEEDEDQDLASKIAQMEKELAELEEEELDAETDEEQEDSEHEDLVEEVPAEVTADHYVEQFCFPESSEGKAHFRKLINIVETKAYVASSEQDDVLGTVTVQKCMNYTPVEPATLDSANIKARILKHWPEISGASPDGFTELQVRLFSHVSTYTDVCMTSETHENHDELMNMYALHAMNHILKTRDRILKNNERLRKAEESEPDLEFHDQGFTRPKVLILLPFKAAAYKLVEKLIALSDTEQQENKKRFRTEFFEESEPNEQKPLDYQQTFEGNIDDCFRIGIKFARKTLRLYSEFYSSDILIASPLGLKMIIAKGDKKKEPDFDFLSSIELAIVDQADVLLMQNWDHVLDVFNHLNLIPKKSHDCDFSRVKHWYLDGKAKYVRQTLLFSNCLTPEINSFMNRNCFNMSGRIKTKTTYKGTVANVIPSVQHVFTRIPCKSVADLDDARLEYFLDKVLPAIKQSTTMQSHTCIVIPSYFDFLRVKEWFVKNELDFEGISEYSTSSEIARARTLFADGRAPLLLITERFHFFRRYKIRGVRNLVFYAPVSHQLFYTEFCNMLGDGTSAVDGSVQCFYARHDALALERIVGTKRIDRMINGEKAVFGFFG